MTLSAVEVNPATDAASIHGGAIPYYYHFLSLVRNSFVHRPERHSGNALGGLGAAGDAVVAD
ncbi:MAG TPA: hypothetical protein VHX37_18405 [Acidobacteriaceae bacterium]|jgi:hypothetical protein|nr:hypothetical protein [Acidobacteriaceae bacterium]